LENAIIIYKSRKGTTKKLSEDISDFLSHSGLYAEVKSIERSYPSEVYGYDYLFPGCWLSFLVSQ
jgi:flavodoxin